MIEIVIPTLWKSPHIHEMLRKYDEHDLVSVIHIMDNAKEFHTHYPNRLPLTKWRVYQPEVYNDWVVNEAWNIGVRKCSDQSVVAILNDDILFDTDVFDFIIRNYEKIGVLGMHKDNYTTTEKDYKIIDIPHQDYGWGCVIFFYKWDWVEIPKELKLFYGDTWQFHMNPIPCKSLSGVPMKGSNISATSAHHELIPTLTGLYKKDMEWWDILADKSRLNWDYNKKGG